MSREIVLKVGAEGGSLTVWRERRGDGEWRFGTERNEIAMYDLLSEEDRADLGDYFDRSGFFPSFQEALRVLDKYSWFNLYPLKVHPEYLESVLHEVNERGGGIEKRRWRKLIGTPVRK